MKIRRNDLMKYLAILVVICVVLSGLIILIVNQSGEEVEKVKEEKQIDDRISPSTNQAIFLEIHRIRKKGIIDVMEDSGLNFLNKLPIKNERLQKIIDGLQPGRGWDVKPSYSFVVTLDDYEEKGRFTYNDWDSGYVNQVVWRNVEEEKTEAPVIFKIVENVEVKKLIGKNIVEKEMESFQLAYDFKTGRWTGDDYFNDSDGYGHFDGENYEVWFSITQTSADEDDIPYWTEVNVLGTDPNEDDTFKDPDEDGIPTVWEWKWGYDPFTWDNHTHLDPDLDGLQNCEEYFMEEWLANPYYQEIYLEADYMDKTPGGPFRLELVKEQGKILPRIKKSGNDGWEHEFYYESQQMLIDLFNKHSISVHIDDGRMGGGGNILPFGRGDGSYQQDSGIVAGFYNNNFPDERKGIFRYVVVAYGGGWCHPQDENHFYDCMCVPHNYKFFKNQLSFALTERTKRIGQAVEVLHELGHSLGMLYLHSSGVDNSSAKAGNPPDYPWLDYISVMNYDYFVVRHFDYSDGSNGVYDADDWGLIDLTFFQRPSEEMEGLMAYD